MHNLKAQAGPSLLVDAGGSLATVARGLSSADPASTKTAASLLERMGFDVVALGETDLRFGRAALAAQVQSAPHVAFVSANLADAATGELVVAPYAVRRLAGRTVALVGLSGGQTNADLALRPPAEALRQAVAAARREAAAVVVLSTAGAAADRALADEVPGIDIYLSASADGTPARPERLANGTLFVALGAVHDRATGSRLAELRVDAGSTGSDNWREIDLGNGP